MSQVSTRNLGKYLKLVKNLEVSVYEQQMVLSSLNRQIVNTYSQKEFAQKKHMIHLWDGCFCAVFGALLFWL